LDAKALETHLQLFTGATSLGGVESTIEWSHRHHPARGMSLLRISVGLEDADELIADLRRGLKML